MLLKFIRTDEDGEPIEEVKQAWINGYAVGDRMLEDVYFRIRINEARDDVLVDVHPQSKEYFDKLNTKHWLKEIKAYVFENDLFMGDDLMEHEIILYDFDKPPEQQAANCTVEPSAFRP